MWQVEIDSECKLNSWEIVLVFLTFFLTEREREREREKEREREDILN